MCIENTLQQIIQQRTGGGEIIADFLFDTVEGKTPAVKTCHQLEAAKHLIRIGYPSDHTATDDRHSREDDNPSLTRHSRESGNPVAQTAQTSPTMSDDHTARPEPVKEPTSSRHSAGTTTHP